MSLLVILAALLGILYWFVRRPAGAPRPARRGHEVDEEILAEAESEVRDVDSFASPEQAEEELRDWGPGAPK